MAPARHHHAVQLRAAAEEHHQVHARQLEGGRLHTPVATVHQTIARQQNLSASVNFIYRPVLLCVFNVYRVKRLCSNNFKARGGEYMRQSSERAGCPHPQIT